MIRDTVPRDRDSHPRSPCYDDLRFISKDPELAAEAVAICGGCEFRACVPVLAEILKSAGRHHLEGVWDGRHYRENVGAVDPQPVKHGTRHSARLHRASGERPCDECRLAENEHAERMRQQKRERGAA